MRYWLPVFLLFLAVSAVFIFGPGALLEPDQFYHFAHASIYAHNGLFQTTFPWTQFSVWKIYQADIWYGFHLLLVPFAVFSGSLLAIKLAALLFTSSALLAFWFTLRRHEIRHPIFWVMLFYFATPNLLLRLNQLRPNTLTIALIALLFSFLIKPHKKQPWRVVGAISFMITFLHLSFFWAAPLVAGIYALTALLVEKRFYWQAQAAVLGGTMLGWFARPNPVGAFHVLKVQLLDLISAKNSGIPLLSGEELLKLDWAAVVSQLIPMLIIAITAISLFIFSKQERKSVLLWSSLSLSAIFLALGFLLGRRATDLLALFTVIFAAYFFSRWRSVLSQYAAGGIFLLFLAMSVWNSYIFTGYAAYPPGGSDQLRSVSLWLKNNSKPGDIVFHTSWDSFPMLFFWNSNNYYINGADPIFEYAYDPKLYAENLFLAIGGKPYTCDSAPCTAQNGKDLYKAIAGDFNAKYIMVELSRNSGLAGNLDKDLRFQKIFSTDEQVIYLVK